MTLVSTKSPVGSSTSAFSRTSTAWDNRLKTFVYILAAAGIALALWFATFEAATLLLHPKFYASRYLGVHILRFTREVRRSSAGRRVETAGTDWRPVPDRHVAEKAVTMSVLSLPHNPLTNRKRTAKLALLFLTDQGLLPLKRVWDRFLQAELKGSVELEGDNSNFSVYVHTGGTEMRYNADEGRFLRRNDIPMSLPPRTFLAPRVSLPPRTPLAPRAPVPLRAALSLRAFLPLRASLRFGVSLSHRRLLPFVFSHHFSCLPHPPSPHLPIPPFRHFLPQVQEGAITAVDAQRRLLAWALLDRDNHFFLFLHHTAIPIQSFSRIYSSLLHSRHSFVAMANDPTAYPRGLAPLVPQHKFARSSKWVAVNRPHATAIVADSMFYRAFKLHCPGTAAVSSGSNSGAPSTSSPAAHTPPAAPACRPDEHYIATFLRTVDPDGVANFTITHEPHMATAAAVHAHMREQALQRTRKRRRQQRREEGAMRRAGAEEGQGGDGEVWQGRREMLERVGEWEEVEYGAVNITSRFIQDMQEATTYFHKIADSVISPTTCRWNGQPKPCFMFARPFRPDSADEIMSILPNVLHY
ncbi:unnamed protein product [Closterium sp. NIES-65]|nr:unnamed protein product [Closterium sp. NIES-65]